MEKYKVGQVFNLYKNNEKEYIVLNKTEIKDEVYLIVAPLKDSKIVDIDSSRIILVKVDSKTDEINIETNEEIIRKVVDSINIGD